jgi:peptide/nickel transport system substrate-binding protein
MTREFCKSTQPDTGDFSRRSLLQSVAGLGAFLALPGQFLPLLSGQAHAQEAGGTLELALPRPAQAFEPLRTADQATSPLIGTFGQYLGWVDQDYVLHPVLAKSWTPDEQAKSWTFELRDDVTFNDGRKMTARDVAYTINLHADPANGSNALSVLKGQVDKNCASVVDDYKVRVDLLRPNGNFPYLVSSDNYNLIILPEGYQPGDFAKSFVATGPWVVTRSDANGITFTRRPDYWDSERTPSLGALNVTYIDSAQNRVIALKGGSIDALTWLSADDMLVLNGDQETVTYSFPSTYFRAIGMGSDKPPFNDKRVRKAVALLLDREMILQGALSGLGAVGNDTPFFPQYASSTNTQPQRVRDVTKARQLLAEAGYPDGFTVTLTTGGTTELEKAAQLIQAFLSEGGINVSLQIMDWATYYGDMKPGSSPFLDSEMTLLEFLSRSIPNVMLSAVYRTGGAYNMMRYSNNQLDEMIDLYISAADLDSQRSISTRIDEILAEEVPMIIPYTSHMNMAWRKNIHGLRMSPTAALELEKVTVTR